MVFCLARRIARPFLMFVVFAHLAGCGTLITKTNPSGDLPVQLGHLYTGVQADIYGIECAFTGPVHAKKEGRPSWSFLLLSPLTFAFFVADFPLSLAADTLFLPLDIWYGPEDRRMTSSDLKC